MSSLRTFVLLLLLVLVVVNAQTGTWNRTQCGKFTDLITQWGLQVNPFKGAILPEYPRPQLVRSDSSSWINLNGLWGYEPTDASSLQNPPFGKTLPQSILVPFLVESCLSGIGVTQKYIWYRLVFTVPKNWINTVLLHFGAVDWQTTVFLNTHNVSTHTGGYDPFTMDLTSFINVGGSNELLVFVFDPSDDGAQPNGKQRISAINNPGGDTYTPSSGIWQTVWLEHVPKVYIESITITTTLSKVVLGTTVRGTNQPVTVSYSIFDGTQPVVSGSGLSSVSTTITVPNPNLWSPKGPFLYRLVITIDGDTVESYFGMRTITLGDYHYPAVPAVGPQQGIDRPGYDMPGYPVTLNTINDCWALCNNTKGCLSWAATFCDGTTNVQCYLKNADPLTTIKQCAASGFQGIPAGTTKRPLLNGQPIFLAGWLDQSWWPDGIYTAPTDEALAFDLQSLSTFGLNAVRLHQKVNPARWYYHADRLGVIVLQDMIQKYGGATSQTIPYFQADLTSMIKGLYNHPSIIQWTIFNEYDCVGVFNVPETVSYAQSLDSTRLFDTNSGGPANDLGLADVNDIHTYPYPGIPLPRSTQYGMVGEFGGIGAFVSGHEWVPGQCQTYLAVNTPTDEANTYISMTQTIATHKDFTFVCIYTQITDVERECDGFLNFDRTNKFDSDHTKAVHDANILLINS